MSRKAFASAEACKGLCDHHRPVFGGLAARVAPPFVNLRAASLHFSGIILFFIKV